MIKLECLGDLGWVRKMTIFPTQDFVDVINTPFVSFMCKCFYSILPVSLVFSKYSKRMREQRNDSALIKPNNQIIERTRTKRARIPVSPLSLQVYLPNEPDGTLSLAPL